MYQNKVRFVLTAKSFKQAGISACFVFCASCAQLALVSVSPIIAALSNRADQSVAREIIELEQKQDWSGMLKLARFQVQRDPRISDWWFLQGYVLARQELHAEAVESYDQAIRISPEEESSWLFLGQSQRELGLPERAIQTYEQALRHRPESAPTYLALADIYQQQEQPDHAIRNYRESLRYAPGSAPAWYGLALAYHLTGQRQRRDEALLGLRRIDAVAAAQFEKQNLSK